jgi:hypothetical protein
VSTGDFSGADFAAGDVRGLRLWNPAVPRNDPDPDNPTQVLLKSVYREFYWTPGINRASCHPLGRGATTNKNLLRLSVCKSEHKHGPEWPLPVATADSTCHRAHATGIDPDCECGFYAYTNTAEDNPYLRTDRNLHVQGVIQGWGRTVIGTKGFRCTLARIVAIVLPMYIHDQLSSAQQEKAERCERALRRTYPDIPVFDSVPAMLDAYPLHDGSVPSTR